MARIQMYTTAWCGYCVRAETLLDSRGLEYEEISLDDDPAFRQRLLDLTGSWTVPQILVDGRPIGGGTEPCPSRRPARGAKPVPGHGAAHPTRAGGHRHKAPPPPPAFP